MNAAQCCLYFIIYLYIKSYIIIHWFDRASRSNCCSLTATTIMSSQQITSYQLKMIHNPVNELRHNKWQNGHKTNQLEIPSVTIRLFPHVPLFSQDFPSCPIVFLSFPTFFHRFSQGVHRCFPLRFSKKNHTCVLICS